MFSVLSRRTLAMAVASFALVGVTAACGAVDTAATCNEATKALQDYTNQMATAGSDVNALNKANSDLAGKLKELADKSDGELAEALNQMSTTWGNFQVNPDNPAEAASKAAELSQNSQEAVTKLAAACGG